MEVHNRDNCIKQALPWDLENYTLIYPWVRMAIPLPEGHSHVTDEKLQDHRDQISYTRSVIHASQR